nr:probable F-box protein At4g22030 [Ipomoea batatas]
MQQAIGDETSVEVEIDQEQIEDEANLRETNKDVVVETREGSQVEVDQPLEDVPNVGVEANLRDVEHVEVDTHPTTMVLASVNGLILAAATMAGIAATVAAIGASLVGPSATVIGVDAGALAVVVNTLQHGGQVGMVFGKYRSNASFFKLVALKLGRSLSELKDLDAKSRSLQNEEIDEFASKLF